MRIGLKRFAIGLMAAAAGIVATTVAGLVFTWSPLNHVGVPAAQFLLGAIAGGAGATSAACILRWFGSDGLLRPLGFTIAAFSLSIGLASLLPFGADGWLVLVAWFAYALPWAWAAIAAPLTADLKTD